MPDDKPKRSIDLASLGIWLQPKQQQFLDGMKSTGVDVASRWFIGGSRGSAKSGGLRRGAISLALDYPEIVIYVVRRVLGDLLENHMEKIKMEFPQVHSFYKLGAHEYEFPNGSRIAYVMAPSKTDVDRVSYGPECTFLFIDQAEQFTEDELISFKICNRWPNMPRGFVKSAYFFNVGKGHGAAYFRRICHTRTFRKNEDGSWKERPEDYAFIPTYSWDNYEWFRGQIPETREEFYQLSSDERFALFVTQTDEGQKMNSLPKHRREGELLGNFDSFSGQYFSDVWGNHCVIEAD